MKVKEKSLSEPRAKQIEIIIADNNLSSEENNLFFHFLFSLDIPVRIIVQRSMLENGKFPSEYLERENLLPLHGDGFIGAAKGKLNVKRYILFKKPVKCPKEVFEKLSRSNTSGLTFRLKAYSLIRFNKNKA